MYKFDRAFSCSMTTKSIITVITIEKSFSLCNVPMYSSLSKRRFLVLGRRRLLCLLGHRIPPLLFLPYEGCRALLEREKEERERGKLQCNADRRRRKGKERVGREKGIIAMPHPIPSHARNAYWQGERDIRRKKGHFRPTLFLGRLYQYY